jgi:hypothetical protein
MLRLQKCGAPLLSSDDLARRFSITSHYFVVGSGCLSNLSSLMMFAEGETYAPEAEVSFLSSVALTRGSSDGKGPVGSRNVVASKSRNRIKNGEPRTRITSAMPIRVRRKNTEPALTTCVSIVSSIPTTYAAMQLSFENGASN